ILSAANASLREAFAESKDPYTRKQAGVIGSSAIRNLPGAIIIAIQFLRLSEVSAYRYPGWLVNRG
ncbi:MAG: hypothetical protein WBQ64_07825, partial [Terriglobales bacterium]